VDATERLRSTSQISRTASGLQDPSCGPGLHIDLTRRRLNKASLFSFFVERAYWQWLRPGRASNSRPQRHPLSGVAHRTCIETQCNTVDRDYKSYIRATYIRSKHGYTLNLIYRTLAMAAAGSGLRQPPTQRDRPKRSVTQSTGNIHDRPT